MANENSGKEALPLVLGIAGAVGAVVLLRKKPPQPGPQLSAVGSPTIS